MLLVRVCLCSSVLLVAGTSTERRGQTEDHEADGVGQRAGENPASVAGD